MIGQTQRALQAWEIAAESLGLTTAPRVRPTVLQWLWFCYFGRLPEECRVWVLYDTTCSTWVTRYLCRSVVAAVLPVAVLALALPASLPVRLLTSIVTGVGVLLFGGIWINELCEHRLIQAGYRWTIAQQLRAKRDEVAQGLQVW